jgi:SAM-dependent methyltransferase
LKDLAKKSVTPTGWASTGRELEISLRGRRMLSVALAEGAEANAQQFYFSRSLKDMKAALRVFAQHRKTLPLHAGALVFEPGCNAGRYLFYFADRYGCRVFGADVYAPAIDVAKCIALFPGEQFIVTDLVTGKMLEAFSDRHFDMVFLSSHLAHVIHLPGGVKKYLERLMRISKTVIFVEKLEHETQVAAVQLGFWTLPWEGTLLGHFRHENPPKSTA